MKRAFILMTALMLAAFCLNPAIAGAEPDGAELPAENCMKILLRFGERIIQGVRNGWHDALTEPDPGEDNDRAEEDCEMKMMIGETAVRVEWEKNESVDALRELAKGGLTIQMSMYGGFEQVGSIGASLPRNDAQTTTSSGDIVLYAGDQIVVFYGSNSWAYTRLGRITDRSAREMRDLLGNGDVVISLTAD